MPGHRRHIAILGATGSIGRNTLEVVRALPNRFEITALTTNGNIDLLEQQISEFNPRVVVVHDAEKAGELRARLGRRTEVLSGIAGVLDVVRRSDVDVVVAAMVGFAGVAPTAEAIRHGKHIALANKETLVAAGAHIMELVRQKGVTLVPIDSEHSAILQSLVGEQTESIAKLILTASGGPFRDTPSDQFSRITVEDALKHPNWSMGNKITVDSASLMNKGLEVIEAHWLFGLSAQQIEVVVHPQSIIHSMVEFVDGSVKAQLGLPDMKLPIQYALTYPERVAMQGPRVSFPSLRTLTFFEPDLERFPALRLAYDALASGGTMPAVMNAANEIAVAAFLSRGIPFTAITSVIRKTMDRHDPSANAGLDAVIEADRWAREIARTLLAGLTL